MSTHSYIKLSCPCNRPHNKTHTKGVIYTTDDCDRLFGGVSTDTQNAQLAFYCPDCKRVTEVTVRDGVIEMHPFEERTRINTTIGTVVIT
ncbi:MAG: hypothetical protein GY941_22160 [Planctomycetes bacterium]|nr:hypothetical protein [Planctomycetota bacterium]